MVGYRATRPIMELAWKVLGETGSLVSVRDGSPVQIIRTRSYEESLAKARDILERYRQERPQSLVAVVCRYIKDVDRLSIKSYRVWECPESGGTPGKIFLFSRASSSRMPTR